MAFLVALALIVVWGMWAWAIVGIGLLIGATREWTSFCLRLSIWRGLTVVIATVLAWQLVLPAGGPSGLALCGLLAATGVLGWIRSSRVGPGIGGALRWSRSGALFVGVLAVVLVLAAFWAAGVPTNYDTGLYHLGAISYATDFPVIPGLANLHDRFGFNSSLWPFAALLGTGPFSGQGFRIIVGLLLTLAFVDLALRISRAESARRSAGTYAMVIGLAFAVGAFAQYPGRLLASSAQDSAALILLLVSTAYLLDVVFAQDGLGLVSTSRITLMTTVVAATIRPLGWAFAFGIAAVTLVCWWRASGWRSAVRALWPAWLGSAAILAIMLVRDVLLSGWLLFPLTAFPMPVSWRAVDPWSAARDITGWARTPFQDVDLTLQDQSWILGWVMRLPTDWSIPALALILVVLAAILIGSPAARRVLAVQRGRMLLALVPALLALVLWFVNAPDPRFAWGLTLSLGLIPLSAVLAGLGAWRWTYRASALLLGLLLLLAMARGSFGELRWGFVAPPTPYTKQAQLADGTPVTIPMSSDQCWSVYPLCTPGYSSLEIALRGTGIGAGFVPLREGP